jgi:signal transduction histidine kinase
MATFGYIAIAVGGLSAIRGSVLAAAVWLVASFSAVFVWWDYMKIQQRFPLLGLRFGKVFATVGAIAVAIFALTTARDVAATAAFAKQSSQSTATAATIIAANATAQRNFETNSATATAARATAEVRSVTATAEALVLMATRDEAARVSKQAAEAAQRESAQARIAADKLRAELEEQAMFGRPGEAGGKYSSLIRDRVNSYVDQKACGRLQAEFDAAEANGAATRARTGTGPADLMKYIDEKMRTAGCYERR